MDHGARDHATWAASATARNWACSGSLALTGEIKTPERENEAAAWGTACHQLSEKCLRLGDDAAERIGTTEVTKAHSFEVDEEMADTAQQYVDYVRGRIQKYIEIENDDPVVSYEQHFSLESLKPPFDAGGTGDTVIYFPKWRLIEVVDLKGGRGVLVEVEENKQLRTYGLGAVLTNPGIDVEKVRVTIVQPRMQHTSGRIRSDEFHVADLIEWTAELLKRMHRAKQAIADRKTAIPAMWNTAYLVAGDHCKFCRAKPSCPELERKAMDAAGVWFDDLDKPRVNAPDSFSADQLAEKLDMFDMIGEWMNAVRAHAQELAESGVAIPNYQLTEKIGHRKWRDEEKTRETLFLEADLTDDQLYNKKLKSPAQIEKTLGAKKAKALKPKLDELTDRPVTGTSLVRTTKTTRPAVQAAVNKHFQPIED